ncbi:hypothetical protein ACIBCH_09915 [Amycolatopsis thailandensis]|uniref:hypothetical protein n=1 Tax=Amycolatopsis thailandensis TaxID=589330 RepID=UPI0037A52D86
MDQSALDTLLEESKPASATVRLCLRADLQADWERFDAELLKLKRRTSYTLAVEVTPEEKALAEQIQALEEQMAAATVEMRVEALPRKAWRELCLEHQPREGNAADAGLLVNTDTFYDALIGACLVDPVLSKKQLEKLLDKLSSYQFDKLCDAAWGVNRRDVEVPFSSTASHTITSSGGTSKPPPGSGSRTAGSAGGNRRKSSSTSTKTAG